MIALGDMPHGPHRTFEVAIGETSFKYSMGHLWLLYLSCDDWPAIGWNYQCSRIKVVFDTNSPRVEVIKCAVRLIYEQDVEEFNLTIAQCSSSCINTSEGWDCVHHEFENSAVVKATKFKATYDDNREAEPSASWSFPEETEGGNHHLTRPSCYKSYFILHNFLYCLDLCVCVYKQIREI